MSEPKHTPGPWYSDDKGRIWRRPPAELAEYGGNWGGDKPLAEVKCGWYAPLEGYPVQANARLFAAAPCLLARLESMAAQHACGCGHPACKRCEDDRMNQEVIERAKGGAE